MDEQIDKGNQYKCTYDRRTDRQGQSIYLRWTNRQKRAINIPTMDEETENFKVNQYTYDGRTDKQEQSIYLRWTKRQTRAINIPMMVEPTDKSNQYTYYG
jgi:hypothetical protein